MSTYTSNQLGINVNVTPIVESPYVQQWDIGYSGPIGNDMDLVTEGGAFILTEGGDFLTTE